MSAEVSYWFEHQEYGVQPGTLWDENKDGIDKLRGGRFAEGVETDYTKKLALTSPEK